MAEKVMGGSKTPKNSQRGKRLKTITLPRKYEYVEGESRPEYKKYNGWNKISVSQNTSFSDDLYRGGYIAKYMMGYPEEQGIFAYFGNAVGDYLNIQDQRIDGYLDDADKKVMDEIIKEHPEGSQFEYEILIDLEPFGLKKTVLQGFSDRQYEKDGKTNICDFKTLNLDKKKDFYSSEEYIQLNIYGYGLEELGFQVGETYVIGLGRKGNTLDKSAVHERTGNSLAIRLSGEYERIDNEYDRQQAIGNIKEIVENCIKISDYYKVFNKFFDN